MPDVTEVNAATGLTTHRDFTPAEVAQRQADATANAAQQAILDALHTNEATLTAQATAALAQNRAAIAATAPTNAQVIAQVKALSAQNNALIRLVLGLLTEID